MAAPVLAWLDRLDKVLESEADLAGLLKHGSTVGQAREFLVSRVLKTLLPSTIHIGSGTIIDAKGDSSKQVDIIIYDPRFPLLELDGGGRYLIEGVIAAIEIKSTIDKRRLKSGLDNCASVLDRVITGLSEEQANTQISYYEKEEGLDRKQAEERFNYRVRPATYLFSFNSKLPKESMQQEVNNWWHAANYGISPYFPKLPRVMITGKIVAVVNDGWAKIVGSNDTPDNIRIMSIFETKTRFRWFAFHLMHQVSSRLGLRNFAESFDYKISDYFPVKDYLNSLSEDVLSISLKK